MDKRGQAVLAVAFGAFLLGLAPIGLRLSELGPQATAFWRFAFAMPVLAIAFAAHEPHLPARRIPLLAAAGVCFALDIALWHAALGYTSVVNATLASNMTPVLAAAAGWLFFKERITRAYLIGACVAIGGAGLLSFARAQSGGPMSGESGLFGDLLGLASAFWYAGYLIILRGVRTDVGARATMLVTTATSALVALGLALAFGEMLMPQTAQGWLMLILLGVLVHAGGQGLIAFGVGRLPIALSTVLLFVQPVAAAIWSWMLFGEALSTLALLGGALVLGGVWLVQTRRMERNA
ncbi:MAG: DMT family transporter [Hyphomonadaceae bacterium]